MNRTAWKSVIVIVAMLCSASLRLPQTAIARVARNLALPLCAGLTACAAIFVLARVVLSRRPRRRVLWLAARGRSAPHIARETGLAQDAVRALLRPAAPQRVALAGRQALPTGRNVRRGGSRLAAPDAPKWLKRRSTTALGRAMFARHSGC